ncbi:MAG: hypothetical protein ACJ8FS_16350 [Sphingomicrobium sp.]
MTTTVTVDRTLAIANGSAAIPFDFQALSADEIGVTRNGVLADPSTYTVVVNGDGTGMVTPVSTWGTDAVVIYSSPSYQQTAGFTRFGPMYPDQFNGPLDRAARTSIRLANRVQDLEETVLIPGPTGPAGDVAKAADRTALAGITGMVAGTVRYLAESGREGLFVFDGSNLSTKVTADAAQGIYVAPASAPTGAAGAWVRKYSGPAMSSWFGIIGNGSDETTALTCFFNHAISNPGVPHFLEPKTYGISAALPTISVSNVWIEGSGAEIHDTGTLVTGTVIKWVGATSTGTTALKIEPVSGGSNQRLSGVFFRYIGFDCNSGAIGTALSIKSLQESEIDVVTANAFTAAVTLNVIASLGEARDLQRNKIRVNGRQVEAASGYTLTLDGDSSANVSLNEIEVDAQCKNVAAVRCINSDNNYWRYVRASLAGGGTASFGVELLGGASAALSSRSENFEFYSSSLPLKAFGTADYTVASKGHFIQQIDAENSTPAPTRGIGASVAVRNQWTSFTPTVTSGTGALTTVTGASGTYLFLDAGFVDFAINFTLATNGTGATQLRATLPFAAAAGLTRAVSGAELGGTGKNLTCTIAPTGTYVAITFYDGTYPGADGRIFTVSGTYRAAF